MTANGTLTCHVLIVRVHLCGLGYQGTHSWSTKGHQTFMVRFEGGGYMGRESYIVLELSRITPYRKRPGHQAGTNPEPCSRVRPNTYKTMEKPLFSFYHKGSLNWSLSDLPPRTCLPQKTLLEGFAVDSIDLQALELFHPNKVAVHEGSISAWSGKKKKQIMLSWSTLLCKKSTLLFCQTVYSRLHA